MIDSASDRVLLVNEWASVHGAPETCIHCSGRRPKHEDGCEWDLALAERGYPSQEDRDRARKRLKK
jgi:hypothetical protein